MNLCPLQEQRVVLTTVPFLQSHVMSFQSLVLHYEGFFFNLLKQNIFFVSHTSSDLFCFSMFMSTTDFLLLFLGLQDNDNLSIY